MDARTGSAERASATTQEDIARMTAELVQRREALESLRAHLAEARATRGRAPGRVGDGPAPTKRASRAASRSCAPRPPSASAAARRFLSAWPRTKGALRKSRPRSARLREALAAQNETLEAESSAREALRGRIADLEARLEGERTRAAQAQESLHRLQLDLSGRVGGGAQAAPGPHLGAVTS